MKIGDFFYPLIAFLQVSYGISIGTAVRVGHFLGAGHPQLARNSLKVSIIIVGKMNVLLRFT